MNPACDCPTRSHTLLADRCPIRWPAKQLPRIVAYSRGHIHTYVALTTALHGSVAFLSAKLISHLFCITRLDGSRERVHARAQCVTSSVGSHDHKSLRSTCTCVSTVLHATQACITCPLAYTADTHTLARACNHCCSAPPSYTHQDIDAPSARFPVIPFVFIISNRTRVWVRRPYTQTVRVLR